MTEEEAEQFAIQMGDLKNHYEQTIEGLKARIAELEKLQGSGQSQRQKTGTGYAKQSA